MNGIPNELIPHVEALVAATKMNRDTCFAIISILMTPHVSVVDDGQAAALPRDYWKEAEIAVRNMSSCKDQLPKDEKRLMALLDHTRQMAEYCIRQKVDAKKLTAYHFRLRHPVVRKDANGADFYIDFFPASYSFILSSDEKPKPKYIEPGGLAETFARIFQRVEKAVQRYED